MALLRKTAPNLTRCIAVPDAIRCMSTTFLGDYLSMKVTPSGVAIVRLDDKSAKVNALSSKMVDEFETMISAVKSDSSIVSVVLISGKKDTFIAGADIKQLQACSSAEELSELSHSGQNFMDRVSSSRKPFVAAIHGDCLGGGLEIALACHYRIATEHKKTKFALPEVQLGLLPGAGGTQRLPTLIGVQEALTMMLVGGNVRPSKAKKIGLVHQLSDPYALESAAIAAAENLAKGSYQTPKRKTSILEKALATPLGRTLIWQQTTKMLDAKTNKKYPAPYKILECVKEGMEKGFEAGSKLERENFGELGMTCESKALVSLYFGMQALKKNRYGNPDDPISTMGVLGSGLMGTGIAQVSVARGVKVLLKDRAAETVSKGEQTIRGDLDKQVKGRRITTFERDTMMARLVPLSDDDDVWRKHFSQADLIIEAVFEDLGLKHQILREMNDIMKDDCTFATNTSALSVGDIASVAKHPENVVGMHYFSPVPKMPLLEIVGHAGTSQETLSKAMDLGIRQGKQCLQVKDVPGFYVNRCLGPYIAETIALLIDGVDPLKLDSTMKNWGLPVGPITLADEVGIDVAAHVNETLSPALGIRMEGGCPDLFKEFMEHNYLGRKSGKGFYYLSDSDKKGFKLPWVRKPKSVLNAGAMQILQKYVKGDGKIEMDEIIARMMSRFINEAVLCLQDDIIESAQDGDIGAVFGMGFPPFIGGPFRYVDQVGSKNYVEGMLRLAEKHGEQFNPCDLLRDMAKTNRKFYS